MLVQYIHVLVLNVKLLLAELLNGEVLLRISLMKPLFTAGTDGLSLDVALVLTTCETTHAVLARSSTQVSIVQF